MAVTLHTDVGDMKIELHCEICPKTCENFLALCASDYYNGSVFHRNMKGFMVQVGSGTVVTSSFNKPYVLSVQCCTQRQVKRPDVLCSSAQFSAFGMGKIFNTRFDSSATQPSLKFEEQTNKTGDPTGTGKGGTSIWNKKFPDEFKEELKHTTRGVVSMANNGPNTNGSQFFITYSAQPHLDLKYTIFGKLIDGFEALEELEKLSVNPKNYRPVNDTRINAVTIHSNPLALE